MSRKSGLELMGSYCFMKIVGWKYFFRFRRVYKAFSREDSTIYALKKLILSNEEQKKDQFANKEGFPITSLREIKFLQKLDHPNVIKLYDIVTSQGNFPRKNIQIK